MIRGGQQSETVKRSDPAAPAQGGADAALGEEGRRARRGVRAAAGQRILTTAKEGKARLWSRNAIEWTDKIPDIRDAIEALGLTSAALDGELIAGSGTKEDFNLLQATLSGERQGTLAYALFDVLHLDGVDVANAPLTDRKALLQSLLEGAAGHLAFSSHIQGDGEQAYRLAGEQHFEGIISKRGDRPYRGGRCDDWRKTKQLASDEFAVVGYTAPKGSRTGFGSLLLAKPDPEHGWRYVGRVGTGFNDAVLGEITARLTKGGGKKPTAYVGTTDTDLRAATWFEPRFVVEVFFRGIGRQALLRQPSLKAVRPDKGIGELGDSDRDEGLRARPTWPRRPRSRRSQVAGRATRPSASASRPSFRARPRSCSPTLAAPNRTCGTTTRR